MNTTNLMGPKFTIPQHWTQPMQPITTVLEPAPVMVPSLCLEWVVLDIETKGGSELDVEEYIRRTWWPDVRFKDGKVSGWKPETIGERFQEAHQKWAEKSALLDSAEIVTIQVKTSAGQTAVFHTFGNEPIEKMPFIVSPHGSEKEMLTTFAQWLELNCGEGTMLIGWNIQFFDLPKIRMRMVRNGVKVPRVLTGMSGVLDLMRKFVKEWSIERTEFMSLKDAWKSMGKASHKENTDGSMVGEMLEKKEYARLLMYGAGDVMEEVEMFFLLTGQSAA